MNLDILEVTNVEQLKDLAKKLGVRADWHEPDEQGVTAKVMGHQFDNAGIEYEWDWTSGPNYKYDTNKPVELMVHIYQNEKEVFKVNLAILFAFACGTFKGVY